MAGTRLYVILSIIIPVLLISPIAFNYTRVSRSALPHVEMAETYTFSPFVVHINLVQLSSEKSIVANDGASFLRTHYYNQKSSSEDLRLLIDLVLTKVAIDDIVKAKGGLKQIDESLYAFGLENVQNFTESYTFFTYCDRDEKGKQSSWVIGKYKHGWINVCGGSADRHLQTLSEILKHTLIPSPTKMDASTRVTLNYRLSFSILHETAPLVHEKMDNQAFPLPSSDLFGDSMNYLQPFLKKISSLANFTVESERLYYTNLTKGLHYNKNRKEFFVTSKDLQQFMSANDFLTGSVLSEREQVLHFLTYIPDSKHSPLVIYPDEANINQMSYESFDVPGWGGVVISNTIESSEIYHRKRETETVSYFVAQCRHLLGAPAGRSGTKSFNGEVDATFLPSLVDGITDWELDVLMRSWIFRYFTNSAETLSSISKLVLDMPHMTVLPRIKANVDKALELITQFQKKTVDKHQQFSLTNKLSQLRNAMSAVDNAYYDPTMVPQLYFPEEHIYAVYLPLLAPLFLPLIAGFIRELKRYRKKTNLNFGKKDI